MVKSEAIKLIFLSWLKQLSWMYHHCQLALPLLNWEANIKEEPTNFLLATVWK